MALTSISFVFLSLFAIYEVEAVWAPLESPTVTPTCNADTFDLGVQYGAAAAGTTQSNDALIGDNCVQSGAEAGGTANFAGISYGSAVTPACGGTLTVDGDNKVYTVTVTVAVKATKNNILRTYTYTYALTCTVTRTLGVSSGAASFTVTNVAAPQDPVSDQTFELDLTLQLQNDAGDAQSAQFAVNSNENINIVIGENPQSTELKFTVQRCFASTNSDASNTDAIADFFSSGCPVDSSVTIADTAPAVDGTSSYTITTKAFTITGGANNPLYIHCNVFVCLNAEGAGDHGGKCVQDTTDECGIGRKRKRRSAVDVDEQLRGETITSVQTFTIIDDAYTTDCPEGHVFDTLSKLCTQERVLKIEGVHLEKQWEPEYANISSTKFKWFAKNTAREIRALILATGVERQIRGIKVIAARPGSVILTVLITYDEEVEPREGFETFKNMLYHTTPQVSRLVNVLNVIKQKTVELVPVEMGSKSSLDKNFIIVVVFAVVAVLFISAITLYQVQKIRRTPPVTGVTGIDNSAMEKA